MKRVPYEPPGISQLGKIFEPVERRGDELAVRLTERFFDLPPDVREQVLRVVMAGTRGKHGARRELVLYDARDGRRIGTMSEESGLHLAPR